MKKFLSIDEREQFYQYIEQGKLTIAETIKIMRKTAGMTQPDFAKLVGVAPRIITDLERGVANPTLSTLNKIGSKFGLVIKFNR